MCVLTGLRTYKYVQVMRLWISKPQSRLAQVLDSAANCYVLYPAFPATLFPTVSNTRVIRPPGRPPSLTHHIRLPQKFIIPPGISCLCLVIPTSQSTLLLPSGSYWIKCSLLFLLLLAYRESPARVARSCFSVASWRHQAFLLRPSHSYPFSLAHTSSRGCISTHCATVACRIPM